MTTVSPQAPTSLSHHSCSHSACCLAVWTLWLPWLSCSSPWPSVPRPALPCLVLIPRRPAASFTPPRKFHRNLWATIMRPVASAPSLASSSKPKGADRSVLTPVRSGSGNTSPTWSWMSEWLRSYKKGVTSVGGLESRNLSWGSGTPEGTSSMGQIPPPATLWVPSQLFWFIYLF